MMKEAEQRCAAREFAEFWKGKGYEKGQSQSFWLSLLRNVLGVEKPEEFISFENQVKLDHTSFIDGYIPSTHVLIEQKGLGKDLTIRWLIFDSLSTGKAIFNRSWLLKPSTVDCYL